MQPPQKRAYAIGFLIWHVALRFRAEVDRALAPLGLTHTQYAVLASLYGMTLRGMSPNQRQLAEHGGIDPMHVSKIVRALQQAGFIKREADPVDPRAYRLTLTRRGSRTVVEALDLTHELQARLMAPIPAARREAFRADLELLLHAHGWPGGSELPNKDGKR
jgi:MarR family transcriptional regulator, organic hydroperoxide resistance regulator